MAFLAGGPIASAPASSRVVGGAKFTGVLAFILALTESQDTTFFRMYSEIWNNSSPSPTDPWSASAQPTTDWTVVPDGTQQWNKVD